MSDSDSPAPGHGPAYGLSPGPGWVSVPAGLSAYATTPHPEPQPYHRLLRTVRYRWWRPLVGLILGLLVFLFVGIAVYGVATVAGMMLGASYEQVFHRLTDIGSPIGFLLANLALAGGIPAAWTAVGLAHQERIGWLASVECRMRWRFLLLNGGLALAIVVPTYLVYLVLPTGDESRGGSGGGWPGATTFLALAAVIVFTTPLQATGEEYVFRGYLSQAIGAWTRSPVFPALVSATLFALAHGSQGPWLFADRFAFGLVASWLTLHTGGLEAAIGLHTVNNAVALLIASALGELSQAFTLSDITWPIAAVDVAAMLVFAAVSLRFARRWGLAVRSRAVDPRVLAAAPPR